MCEDLILIWQKRSTKCVFENCLCDTHTHACTHTHMCTHILIILSPQGSMWLCQKREMSVYCALLWRSSFATDIFRKDPRRLKCLRKVFSRANQKKNYKILYAHNTAAIRMSKRKEASKNRRFNINFVSVIIFHFWLGIEIYLFLFICYETEICVSEHSLIGDSMWSKFRTHIVRLNGNRQRQSGGLAFTKSL